MIDLNRSRDARSMSARLSIALMFVVLIPMIAMSQPGMGQRGPGAQRMEQLRKIRLMEFLKLDEETSVRFFARYRDHQKDVGAIIKKRSDVIDELFKEMKDEDENVDYAKFIDETMAMEREIIDARAKFLKSLSDILTKRQIAQYVVFERRFNQDVREMLREMNQQQRMRR